jgi:hypothetical protein
MGIRTDVKYDATINHRNIDPSAFVILRLQSNSILNQQVEECAWVAVLVNSRYETIFGFLTHFGRAGEVVPEYRRELRIVGEIIFENAIWYAEVLRQMFGEDENEFAHVFEEDLHQVPEAGDVVFRGPLIWAYHITSS